MLIKPKLSIALIATTALIITATVTAPYSKMFGKQYNKNQDFVCCKGNQLYIHHYYSGRVFWVEVTTGYDEEPIGKPSEDGCNIKCAE